MLFFLILRAVFGKHAAILPRCESDEALEYSKILSNILDVAKNLIPVIDGLRLDDVALGDDFGANEKPGQQSQAPRKKGVYWKLNTKIGDFELADALVTDSTKSAALQHVRTRLNSFTPQEKGELINWGYALADAAMRRRVMGMPPPGSPPIPAGAWPMPQWPL